MAARTSARSKPGPKPGQKFNKDGSPRKKPGPKGGSTRTSARSTTAKRGPGRPKGSTTAKRGPGRPKGTTNAAKTPARRGRPPKPTTQDFSLYAVSDSHLTYLADFTTGETGNFEIVKAATEGGVIEANTPVVAILKEDIAPDTIVAVQRLEFFGADQVPEDAQVVGGTPAKQNASPDRKQTAAEKAKAQGSKPASARSGGSARQSQQAPPPPAVPSDVTDPPASEPAPAGTNPFQD